MKLTDEKQKFYFHGFLNPFPSMKAYGFAHPYYMDVMICMTSFLNIWEKQVALRLVNKTWYDFFDSQEMKTEQKLTIEKSPLDQLTEDKNTTPLVADFFSQQISIFNRNSLRKRIIFRGLKWGAWTLLTGGTTAVIAYTSYGLHAMKSLLNLLQRQFAENNCPQWWNDNVDSTDSWKSLFIHCLGPDFHDWGSQNGICYQILLRAQGQLCSTDLINEDKSGAVLSLMFFSIALVVMLCIPPCGGLNVNDYKLFYKSREIREKVILVLKYLLGASFSKNSDRVLLALQELYPQETQTYPVEIKVYQSELEMPLLSLNQSGSTLFSEQKTFLASEEQKNNFNSSRTSKCMCIIL